MQKKQRFVADQRWDKSQYDSMSSFFEDYFQQINKGFISPTNRVVSGWSIIVDSGLTVKVDQSADSFCLVTERVGFENLQILKTTDIPLTVAVADDDISYVEVQFTSTTSDNQTVAIWDPLANGGVGEEFTQAIDTTDEQIATLVTNVIGFTGDADKLPLATVTAVSGVITTPIPDSRNLLWGATAYNFGSPRTDAGISSMRDMYDALTTIIKQDHNKTDWFEAQPASIDVFRYDIVIGSAAEVIAGDATHEFKDAVTVIVDGNRIFFLDGTHQMTRNEDIGAAGTIHDLLIDFESGNSVLDFNDGTQWILTFSGDRNRIQFNGDTITANDIVISGDFNNFQTWLTNSNITPIDDTGIDNIISYHIVS